LFVHQKYAFDNAIPPGNAVAMLNLLRLGRITAKANLEERAAAVGRAFSARVASSPVGFAQLLASLDFGIGPSREVVIVGEPRADDTASMLRALRRHYAPNKVVLFRPQGEDLREIARLAEYTRYHSSRDGKATAYVCLNYVCNLPTTDIDEMLTPLEEPPQNN
jgi:uncharacterized protein YyaL (SSP411 family)